MAGGGIVVWVCACCIALVLLNMGCLISWAIPDSFERLFVVEAAQ